MKKGFVEVTEETYQRFLEWLNETEGGFNYVHMPVADKTAVYHLDDERYEKTIANRWIGGIPAIYEIRKEEYEQFKG